MRQAGRAHWTVVATAAVAALVAALVASSRESPQTAADRFLTALAKADAETLADLSYFDPPRQRDAVLGAWKDTLRRAEYFRFMWRIQGTTMLPGDRATVVLEFVRDAGTRFAYEENFSLDMVQHEGKWKVDVKAISREMYPALPL
jgi:hypothetical protein